MGRKGNWFSSVKKALSPETKRSKEKGSKKGKSTVEEDSTPHDPRSLPPPLLEEIKLTEVDDEPADVDADVVSQATTDVVRVTAEVQFPGRSKEEVSAIRIQTAFRGFLARRSLRAIRGIVRLKTLVGGPTVKRQTGQALKCMQTLARVQCRIQSTRIKILEENQALQRQLLQKRAKDESLQVGEDWDVSLQSKEQIEANLLSKYEASMRRERALAYAYSHQQNCKKSARPAMLMFMDPNNPHWGWSWVDRWTETHPLEEKITEVGEISISKALDNNPAPMIHQSSRTKPFPRKLKPASPRVAPDDDSKSIRSERNRRHSSVSVSSVTVSKDDELSSIYVVPSYMVSTKSAKAKSRLENGSISASAKKRISFLPASPARPRRLSGPPRMETTTTISNENNVISAA